MTDPEEVKLLTAKGCYPEAVFAAEDRMGRESGVAVSLKENGFVQIRTYNEKGTKDIIYQFNGKDWSLMGERDYGKGDPPRIDTDVR